MPKVTVAICAYNVEETLEKTIASMPQGLADEVILVDDGSSDRTVELGHKLGETLDLKVIVHPENRGYGAVQKTAYAAAMERGADVVALLHGDFQYDPASLPLLVSPILARGADMTFGSRFASDGNPLAGGMPLYRFVGNRITTVAENVMIGTRFTDMHSGMRAFNRKCLLSLPFLAYRNDFTFDKQTTVDAVMSGLRVTEIPIPTRYDHESSSIPTVGSFQYVWHSLVYTARSAAVRGKRGRRWTVTGSKPARPAKENVSATDLWRIASSYVLPNRRVVALGVAESDRLRALVDTEDFDLDESLDGGEAGLVFVDRPVPDKLVAIGRAIHAEGLVVATVGEPRADQDLKEAGFRIIGWDKAGVLVARPDAVR